MIVAFSGKMCSGKDTAADIVQKFMPHFQRKFFGYKLKLIVSILTGTTIEENMTTEGKNRYLPEWGMTLGQMQQKVGTDCMRNNLHINTWLFALFSDYKNDSCWVITDCRFPNEVEAVHQHDAKGIVIRLEGDPSGERAASKRDKNHPSETSLDNYKGFDYVIQNTGTVEELEDKLRPILKTWLESELE